MKKLLLLILAFCSPAFADPLIFPTTVSTSLPCNVKDQIWIVNATSAAITLTLPSAATCTPKITIIKSDSSANAVTISTVSSQTILSTAGNSATSASLSAQGKSFTIVPSGAFWATVASQ